MESLARMSLVSKLLAFVAVGGGLVTTSLAGCTQDGATSASAENEVAVEAWAAGRGYTQVLELSRNGTYRAFVECDVCDPSDVGQGRWEERGGVISVFDWNNGPTKKLARGKYRGCAALLPLPEDGKNSLAGIFFRMDDTCADGL